MGIRDITVVVGFMKEAYEYLIDDYGVKLLVNQEYATKNNLHSLFLAKDRICLLYTSGYRGKGGQTLCAGRIEAD